MKVLNIRAMAEASGIVVEDHEQTRISGTMAQLNALIRAILAEQLDTSVELTWSRKDIPHKESFTIDLAQPIATGPGFKDRMSQVMGKLNSVHTTLNNGYLAAGRVRRAKSEVGEIRQMLNEIFPSSTRH